MFIITFRNVPRFTASSASQIASMCQLPTKSDLSIDFHPSRTKSLRDFSARSRRTSSALGRVLSSDIDESFKLP